MKLLIAFLITVFSFNVFAECKTEALFIGYVKNLKTYEATEFEPEHYSFELKVSPIYIDSDDCPMDPSEVEKIVFTYEGKPRWNNGDKINALMTWDEEKEAYALDIFIKRE